MSKVLSEAISDPETSPAVRNAMKRFELRLRIRRLEEAMEQIRGHLGACLMQRASSDDAVIFEHIEAAHRLANRAHDEQA